MSARRQLETHIHSLHKDQYVAGRKTELRFAPANLESLRSKLQQDRKDIRQLAKEYERRQEEGR